MSLELEVLELKQRLARLEARNAPKGAAVLPAIERKVRMIHPPSEVLLDPRMPSDDDLLSLLSIVRADYPSLRPEEKARAGEDFFAFKMSIRWLLDIGRGRLDMNRTARHWAACARNFASFHKMNIEIGGNQLLAAAIASGDVIFLNPREYPRNLMHVGLREGHGGQPADAQAWRRVLSTGKSPAPSTYRPPEYASGARTIWCGAQ